MAVFTRCTHLKVNGARCKNDAVYNKDLCFEHESRLQRMRRRPAPPSTYNAVPVVSFVYPEDHEAVLENVHSIAHALGHNQIEYRIASVMDRLMNTALRTLRQAGKIEKPVTSEETVRHFRMDSDGNPRAIDDVPEPQPIEPATEAPESATIPAITAQAEEPAQPEARKQSVTSTLPPTIAERKKLECLLSNTYILPNEKIIAPVRHKISRPQDSGRRATAYVFLSNMR